MSEDYKLEEVKSITESLIDSKRTVLKARFKILKGLPEEVANTQIENDEELATHIRDLLQLNFHNAFATYGVLVMEEPENFKIIKSDIKNRKFEFEYNGKLYASLNLLHMLTSYNKEIKDREIDIMNMIENYYVISYNIPFDFDNTGNITKDETLADNVEKWIRRSELKDTVRLKTDDKEVLDVMDKYADLAIKYLVDSLEVQINDELKYLIGE